MKFKNIIIKPELNDKLEQLLHRCLNEEKIEQLASDINKYNIHKITRQ